MKWLIISIVLWLIVVIYGLIVLSKRLRGIIQENDNVYRQEYESRLKGSNPSLVILDEYVQGDGVSSYIDTGWNPTDEPEPEDSVITYKDLEDIDNIDSGQMIF